MLSFYLTQLALLATGTFLLWRSGRLDAGYFAFDDIHMWIWGTGAGAAVILLDIALIRSVPAEWLDDGGINRMLFGTTPVWHILLISLLAAAGEEILFRGVLQEWIGIWGSSLLFVLLHTRYLRKWLLAAVVAAVSVFFGLLTEWTGHLAPAIIAHFWVDSVMGWVIRNRYGKEENG